MKKSDFLFNVGQIVVIENCSDNRAKHNARIGLVLSQPKSIVIKIYRILLNNESMPFFESELAELNHGEQEKEKEKKEGVYY